MKFGYADYMGHSLRILKDDDGAIWFMGTDVGRIVGLSKPLNAILKMGGPDTRLFTDLSQRKKNYLTLFGLLFIAARRANRQGDDFVRWVLKHFTSSIDIFESRADDLILTEVTDDEMLFYRGGLA